MRYGFRGDARLHLGVYLPRRIDRLIMSNFQMGQTPHLWLSWIELFWARYRQMSAGASSAIQHTGGPSVSSRTVIALSTYSRKMVKANGFFTRMQLRPRLPMIKAAMKKPIRAKGEPLHGPMPDRLKLNGDWKAAIKKSLQKKRPMKAGLLKADQLILDIKKNKSHNR